MNNTEASHHVLYVIDQLCSPFGGAERMLLKTVGSLPHRCRATILTLATNLSGEELAEFSCPVVLFPMRCAYDLNAIKMGFRLLMLIRREKVDIVHTFFESSDLWAGTIAKILARVAVVSSRRDMGILRNHKHKLLYRVLNRVPDRVIAVSEQVRRFVIESDGTPAERVVTIYNGLEVPRNPSAECREIMRRKLGVAAEEKLIISVGNVRRVKGFDVLVQAAARICAKDSRAKFLIVGGVAEPDCFEDLQRQVRELGPKGRFRFAGESNSVGDYLAASDVFVLPSRSEGFSNALIEAMAASLPCVATDVGGNSEAVEDGVSGFIIPSQDADTLADRVGRLIQDPELANRMGRAGRKRLEEKFTLDAMMKQLTAEYARLTS